MALSAKTAAKRLHVCYGGAWGNGFGVHNALDGGGVHHGQDVPRPALSPTYALRGGKVVARGYSTAVGGYVVVKDADGYTSYRHQIFLVKLGRTVVAGQLLGRSAGRFNRHGAAWTGPHICVTRGSAVDVWAGLHVTNPAPFMRLQLATHPVKK